ncbi:hypothetical protein ACN27G_25495 [Plantactinospora sp. WMMB334]|uniref:hypothetical protein n=1 Tax=Plantactinospora sp. WMMB334 TaxID=3404119 RepID=UPI003B9516C5
MAYRTWGRVLLAALLVGIVGGAGQLGIAYGLGLVRFDRPFAASTVNQWPAQLAWVSWFAMVAAVLGGMLADRLARRYALPTALGARAAIAAVAALGALAVAPLCMQPARTAQLASADPVTTTGVAAAIGAGIGFLAALAALSLRPVAWNIAAVTGAAWFLAIVSVLPSLGPADPLPAVRLGGVDPSWLSAGTSQRLAVVAMPALALVAGALTGALARWCERPVPVVASCGVAGPAMLGLAYVVAGRGEQTDAYQAAPYWGALIAVGAGALGSVLAATLRWPLVTTAPAETAATGSTGDTDRPATTSAATTDTGRAADDTDTDTMVIPTTGAGRMAGGDDTVPLAAGGSDTEAPTTILSTTRTPPAGTTTAGTTTAGPGTSGTPSSASTTPSIGTPGGTPVDTIWRTGIPIPRRSTEYSASTEPIGQSTGRDGPTTADRGDSSAPARSETPPRNTTPQAPPDTTGPSGVTDTGPRAEPTDAGYPPGWSGARRLRTEDFWPATPPTTPPPPPPPSPLSSPSPSPSPLSSPSPSPLSSSSSSSSSSPLSPPPSPAPPSAPWTVPAPRAAQSTPTTRSAQAEHPVPESPDAATSGADTSRGAGTPSLAETSWNAFAPVTRPGPDRQEPRPAPAPARAHRPAQRGEAGTAGDGPTGAAGRPAEASTAGNRMEASTAERTGTAGIRPVPVISGDTPVPTTPDRTSPPTATGPQATAGVRSAATTGPQATADARSAATTGPQATADARSAATTGPQATPDARSAATTGPQATPDARSAATTGPQATPDARSAATTGPQATPDARSAATTGPQATARPDTAAQPDTAATTGPQAATEAETTAETTAEVAVSGEADRPTGRIRRGLFRRNRNGSASDPEPTATTGSSGNSDTADNGKGESKQREPKGRNRTNEPVPAHDEEYVDWVSGLSEPDPASDLRLDGSVRRSLRSNGRHHADPDD